jgi:hypothetical protein
MLCNLSQVCCMGFGGVTQGSYAKFLRLAVASVQESISWTFGELESVLAHVHDIDQSKRTAFQARLKNFHRLGYPIAFQTTKGRAASYAACQIAEMALAVEMTQLGLPPERVTLVLGANRWPTLMAFQMAARQLLEAPEGFSDQRPDRTLPHSMFLYFDPAALNSLTLHLPASVLPDLDEASNSFFYGGIGILREGIADWTSGRSCRLSIINVTAMIDAVAVSPFEQGTAEALNYRIAFFGQLESGAASAQRDWEGCDEAEAEQAGRTLEREAILDAEELAERLGIPADRAAQYIQVEAGNRKDQA